MDAGILDANLSAERRLAAILGQQVRAAVPPPTSAEQALRTELAQSDLTLLLMPNEVNGAHGTGILAHRLLRDVWPLGVVRTFNHYDGTCLLKCPDLLLPNGTAGREEIFRLASECFSPGQIKQVVCIPWYAQEIMLAIALKQIFGTRFVLYLMDDNCLYTGYLSPDLMEEAILAADVVFTISPEMQNEYQSRFRRKLWILPPILEQSLLLPPGADANRAEPGVRGVIVGNIWRQSSLDELCRALIGSGLSLDWYCNQASPVWLELDTTALAEAGITFHPPLPEAELVQVLRRAPYAVLPSSSLIGDDPSQNIGRLSLPSRVPFIAASAGTPIIVLGSDRTSAGAFVKHFGLGMAAAYEPEAIAAAAATVSDPAFRTQVTETARRIGPVFSSVGVAAWMFKAAELGRPPDHRFEELVDYRRDDFSYYIPSPAPKGVWCDFVPTFQALERLKSQGMNPDFILDVGASTGIWSASIAPLFPDAHYVLVDPLFDRYPPEHIHWQVVHLKRHDLVAAAVSDHIGEMSLEVSDNLYGSSLIGVGVQGPETQIVPVTTLEQIQKDYRLTGRGVIKIDVQFAEHLVIAGGRDFLSQNIDCIVIELTLERLYPGVQTLVEVLTDLEGMGFRWVDCAGEWRLPRTGRLEQLDLVLVRRDSAWS